MNRPVLYVFSKAERKTTLERKLEHINTSFKAEKAKTYLVFLLLGQKEEKEEEERNRPNLKIF